jgi:hypothetical protein
VLETAFFSGAKLPQTLACFTGITGWKLAAVVSCRNYQSLYVFFFLQETFLYLFLKACFKGEIREVFG